VLINFLPSTTPPSSPTPHRLSFLLLCISFVSVGSLWYYYYTVPSSPPAASLRNRKIFTGLPEHVSHSIKSSKRSKQVSYCPAIHPRYASLELHPKIARGELVCSKTQGSLPRVPQSCTSTPHENPNALIPANPVF
jgi:hypothetical protein